MAEYPLFPDLGEFPGSANIHIENGKAMPTFDHGAMTNSADILHYFIKEAIETQNPAGNPRQYAFGNNVAFFHEDGARTTDQTFTAAAAVQGACIVEGPPITVGTAPAGDVGVKKLLVTFGAAPGLTAETFRLRTLTTDTSPWTAAVPTSTATALTAFGIIALGDGSMIAATGSAQSGTNIGRTTLGEYFIAKCPRGDDPTLAASWGNVQAVGTPEWPIIGMAPFRDTFAIAKGDGCYVWDDRVKRFRNMLDRVKFLPHALNGKGMAAGENGVWYPMADGRLFFFDGVTMRDETPFKGKVLPRDVAQSRISAITDRGDIVAAIKEANYATLVGPIASAALGLKVIKVTGAGQTATDITAAVVDGSLATPAAGAPNMGSWGANATDKLYIGSSTPFEGIVVRVTRAPNSAVNSFTSPQYSDGAAGWPSLGTIRDSSILGTAAISLALTGYPPGASNALLSWTGRQAYDLMTLESVAFGGSVGTVGPLYWARFSPVTTTGMTSTTIIDEVEIIPARGGLPNTGLLGTTTNFTHRTNANCTTQVLIGRRKGTSTIVWNVEYEIDDGGGVWALAWTTARSGTMSNGGNPLLLWGRFQQTIIAESTTRDPSRTLYPKLVQIGTTKPAPRLAFRKIRAGDPKFRKDAMRISVDGQFIQPTDKVSCYAWWDNNDKAFEWDTVSGAPMVFKPPPGFPQTGRELNFDLVFSDVAQTEATAPYISRVILEAEDTGEAFDWIGPDQAIPAKENI